MKKALYLIAFVSITLAMASASAQSSTPPLIDNITYVMLYYSNVHGNTTITNMTGITVQPGKSFWYNITVYNQGGKPDTISGVGFGTGFTGESPFTLDLNSSTIFNTTIPPHSSRIIRLKVDTSNTTIWNGPVPVQISYYNQTFVYTGGPTGSSAPPEPTGVATYGWYGNSSTYTVKTSEVAGYANVSSFNGYSVNYTSKSIAGIGSRILGSMSPAGFSFQLNAVLVVVDSSSSKSYWLQNGVGFSNEPSDKGVRVGFGDSMYNASNGGLSVSYLNGTGNHTLIDGYYQKSVVTPLNATLPLQVGVYMKTEMQPGGVAIYYGYKTSRNSDILWYDKITIEDPDAQNAYFLVTSENNTPMGLRNDAEFVTGAGAYTYYNELDSTIGLFYYNSTTNKYQSFPSLYDTGSDTYESAFDVNVKPENGYGVLSAGSPYYGALTNEMATPPSFLLGSSVFLWNSTTTSTTTTITVNASSSSTVQISQNTTNSGGILGAIISAIENFFSFKWV